MSSLVAVLRSTALSLAGVCHYRNFRPLLRQRVSSTGWLNTTEEGRILSILGHLISILCHARYLQMQWEPGWDGKDIKNDKPFGGENGRLLRAEQRHADVES